MGRPVLSFWKGFRLLPFVPSLLLSLLLLFRGMDNHFEAVIAATKRTGMVKMIVGQFATGLKATLPMRVRITAVIERSVFFIVVPC